MLFQSVRCASLKRGKFQELTRKCEAGPETLPPSVRVTRGRMAFEASFHKKLALVMVYSVRKTDGNSFCGDAERLRQ